MKAGAVKKIEAHAFEQQAEEFYPEPAWVDDVLFKAEVFDGNILDPCCGWGRIPRAAERAGYTGRVAGWDIVDRGHPGVIIQDFTRVPFHNSVDNLVFNPPFDLCREFIETALMVARRKVAAIMPCKRLNAAHWLAGLPLQHVWFLTPRPSMPPGKVVEELAISRGVEPSGGTVEFCWLVFDHTYLGRPELGWLHRDRGTVR